MGLGAGGDHHTKILIDLQDAYSGARKTLSLRMPVMDAQGHATLQERQIVNIPAGVREGQHLRLPGLGGNGQGDIPAGDLYLEIAFRPHPHFRIDRRDIYLDLPLAPWEAALGATCWWSNCLMKSRRFERAYAAPGSHERMMRLTRRPRP
jgi:curved DNA-binding protein